MRRNNIDIQADLLAIAESGARKTHLVYQANLNFSIVKRYLRRMIDNGLLEQKGGTYTTTEEGKKFLAKYSELAEIAEGSLVVSP